MTVKAANREVWLGDEEVPARHLSELERVG